MPLDHTVGQIFGQHDLRNEDLLSAVQHFPLTGRESALRFPNHQAFDNAGDLVEVSTLDPVQIFTVSAIPVACHVNLQAGQRIDHLVGILGIYHRPQPDGVAVCSGDFNTSPFTGIRKT